MDEQGDYDACPPDGEEQEQMYRLAKKGDALAAKLLMLMRTHYEYEYTGIREVIEPL